jgi:radical SAM protein with 4Fe4S-binding SPASM domain
MGEPLLHPQLPEFIKMSGERGYKSIITTNGTLLSRRGDEIIAAGIHKINISLHSFEEESADGHNAYLSGIVDFAKKAAEAGIIVVLRFWNRGVDGTQNDFALDSLKENIEGEWKENTRGIKVRDKIFIDFGERFEWPDLAADVKGTRFSCYGLRDQFGILADGTVVPCCLDSEGVINLGNVFEQDIESILSSDRAVNIVKCFNSGKAAEELCRRCGYARRFV